MYNKTPESRLLTTTDDPIFDPQTFEENAPAFHDTQRYVVKNVPRELDGFTFFKTVEKFIRKDPIEFQVTNDVTFYICYDARSTNPEPSNTDG